MIIKRKKKIFGYLEKPRISVFRSNKHIYAQVIDDYKGHTLIYVSSKNFDFKNLKKKDISYKLGKILGKKIYSYGIKKIVFDRNRYIYHGRVKALAEGLRNVGLKALAEGLRNVGLKALAEGLRNVGLQF